MTGRSVGGCAAVLAGLLVVAGCAATPVSTDTTPTKKVTPAPEKSTGVRDTSTPKPIVDPGEGETVGRWVPRRGTPWQWQLSGKLDLTVDAPVYDIDGAGTTAAQIAELHRAGRRAICYVNVGAYENFRSDEGRFPAAVLGKPLEGWPDERWLDIRRTDLLDPIMSARFADCRSKGFDAVEPDNVDGYANSSGFPLTAADQLRYNRWIAGLAHSRGMSVALKNDVEQVGALEPFFDFAVNEQCVEFDECESLMLPTAPAVGTATAGNASATAVWTASSNNGGSAITGYEVRVVAGTTQVGALRPAAAGATSLAVTGLTNGTAYTLQVRALNAAGAGAYSAMSNAVMPKGVPSTPAIGTPTAGNTTATVYWAAPSSNGGSAITSYTIRVYRLGAVVSTRTAASTARSLVVTGLGNGSSYSFTVAAVNAFGTGPFSATSTSVIPKGAPWAPVIGTATAGVASATARWTAPTSNGGSAITSYLVRTYRAGVLINTKQVAATARNLTLTSLIKGQAHRFTVAAVNAIGTSGYSASSNTVYPT